MRTCPDAKSPGTLVLDFLAFSLQEKKCAIYNVPSNFFYSSLNGLRQLQIIFLLLILLNLLKFHCIIFYHYHVSNEQERMQNVTILFIKKRLVFYLQLTDH